MTLCCYCRAIDRTFWPSEQHLPTFEHTEQIVERRKQNECARAERYQQKPQRLGRCGGRLNGDVWLDDVGILRERPTPQNEYT
jgi:hypothetical protein